jgi:DNA processing protein
VVEEKIYKIAISLLPGIGPVKAKTMVAACGGLEGFFKESKAALGKIEGIGSIAANGLNRKAALMRAEKELAFTEKEGIRIYGYQDLDYPAKLKFCVDAPLVLFTKGNVNFTKQNIAIVGTRKATAYGKQITDQFVKDLVPHDVQIVSGLAHGIDKEAHEAALRHDLPTIAVLGHGLDLIYPAAHKGLARRMLERGGLVTEFISETPGDPSNFPKRNRIVAGLSSATVVVESALKGGSLITANLAIDYNRDVFAFPGNVTNLSAQGCNHLIRSQRAHLITCAEDMIEVLGWDLNPSNFSVQRDLFPETTPIEQKIISVLKNQEKATIDIITHHTKIPSSELSLHLFNLEMKGLIQSLPGQRFELN